MLATAPPTIPPTTLVDVASTGGEFNFQLGNAGEWAAALATLGALVFAWIQIRSEREGTREALAQGAAQVEALKEQLQIERDRYSHEQRLHRERFARLVEVHVDISGGLGAARIIVLNRSGLTISALEAHLLDKGKVVRQAKLDVLATSGRWEHPFEVLFGRKTDLDACVCFVDSDGVRWRRWARSGLLELAGPNDGLDEV
jgi:hypothetical protein